MSFKVELLAKGERSFTSNGLRFATRREAEDSAQELASRWTLVDTWRVTEVADAVTYKFEAGRNVRLEEPRSRRFPTGSEQECGVAFPGPRHPQTCLLVERHAGRHGVKEDAP